MLSVDRDALLCDMAETYGIYDLHALPVETLAALSFGLGADSRIKSKALGVKRVSSMELLASIADDIAMIRYALRSDDSQPKPKLFQAEMYKDFKRPDEKIYKFASSEEFKDYWRSI